MPCAILHLSCTATKEVQETIATESAKILAKVIGKPVAYCMAQVVLSVGSFGGSNEPSAFIDVKSIGGLKGKQENLSAAFSELLQKEVSIEPSRTYLNFTEFSGSNWGYDGATF